MAHLREGARHTSLRIGKSAPGAADPNLRKQRMRNPNDESIEATLSLQRAEQTKDGVIKMKKVRSKFVVVGISGQLRVIGWAALPYA
jgi:hypothetical protein